MSQSKSWVEKEKFDHLQMERQLNRDNFSKELEDTWKELEKVINKKEELDEEIPGCLRKSA